VTHVWSDTVPVLLSGKELIEGTFLAPFLAMLTWAMTVFGAPRKVLCQSLIGICPDPSLAFTLTIRIGFCIFGISWVVTMMSGDIEHLLLSGSFLINTRTPIVFGTPSKHFIPPFVWVTFWLRCPRAIRQCL
jgi:hypothetical protein